MKAQVGFVSPLADRMVQFVAFKRMQGYDYADGIHCLRRFDLFLSKEGCPDGVLHAETMNRYCTEMTGLSVSTREGLQSVLRQFSLYLHAFEPQSVILPARFLPRHSRQIRFHPLSEEHIAKLMAATEILSPKNGIRPHCIHFLIGLLYSTGLRISEALALNLRDVNTEYATLFVRRGKFRKQRLVPMSPSTLDAMATWLEHRKQYAGSKASAPLFIVKWNKRPNRDQVYRTFRRLCKHCGMDGDPPPRLHDLRHNYACRRIVLWREAQEDVDALLPVLGNAMGHVDFFATQVYIHIDAGSLQQASAKFNAHFTHSLENSK